MDKKLKLYLFATASHFMAALLFFINATITDGDTRIWIILSMLFVGTGVVNLFMYRKEKGKIV